MVGTMVRVQYKSNAMDGIMVVQWSNGVPMVGRISTTKVQVWYKGGTTLAQYKGITVVCKINCTFVKKCYKN